LAACEAAVTEAIEEQEQFAQAAGDAERALKAASGQVEEAGQQEYFHLQKLKTARLAQAEAVESTRKLRQSQTEKAKKFKILEVECGSRNTLSELEEAKRIAEEAVEAARKAVEESKEKEREALQALKDGRKEQDEFDSDKLTAIIEEETALKQALAKEKKDAENKVSKTIPAEMQEIEKACAMRDRECQKRREQAVGLGKGGGRGRAGGRWAAKRAVEEATAGEVAAKAPRIAVDVE